MRAIIRYPKRREVRLLGGRKVGDALKELRINPETVIVLLGTTLLTHDVYIEEDEVVEIRSAISGG